MPHPTTRGRLGGFADAFDEVGVGWAELTLVNAPGNSREAAAAAVAGLFEEPAPPTAVLAGSDVLALGVLDALAARPGRDRPPVSVTGFDDIPRPPRPASPQCGNRPKKRPDRRPTAARPARGRRGRSCAAAHRTRRPGSTGPVPGADHGTSHRIRHRARRHEPARQLGPTERPGPGRPPASGPAHPTRQAAAVALRRLADRIQPRQVPSTPLLLIRSKPIPVRTGRTVQVRARRVVEGGTARQNGEAMSPFTPTLRLHDRYVLHERIGLGGMSEVWRGDDEVLGRPVAIKVLAGQFATDPQLRATIQREARAAARLTHPHVTQVYDYAEATLSGGVVVPYLVMELVEGHNLADRLRTGPLPWPEAVRVAGQIAAALAAAHRIGVVHRDVKPGNVMLTDTGAKVLDFGIAALGGLDSQSGEPLMGTPPTSLRNG
ncbi:protein kinase [Micromonospora sp. M12]